MSGLTMGGAINPLPYTPSKASCLLNHSNKSNYSSKHVGLVLRQFLLRLFALTPLPIYSHSLICALLSFGLSPFGWLRPITLTPYS